VAVELGHQGWVRSVAALRPRVIIHAAALTDVDFCQRQPALALEVNRDGTRRLAEAADPWCERFIYCSTDLVFDGGQGFYRETDTPRPLMVYGESKLAGERELRARLGARALIVRLALLYGLSPSGRENFCQHLVREGRAGRPVPLFTDPFRTPLYIDDAARGLEMLVTASDPPACLHFAGPERLHEMGLIAARVFGFDPALASPRRLSESRGFGSPSGRRFARHNAGPERRLFAARHGPGAGIDARRAVLSGERSGAEATASARSIEAFPARSWRARPRLPGSR
jgi:dTDP-4-dehydrorhamnose reductase